MANYDTSIRAKILVDTKDLERAEKEIESLTKKLDAAKKFEEIGGSPEQAKALGYNVKALEKQLADATARLNQLKNGFDVLQQEDGFVAFDTKQFADFKENFGFDKEVQGFKKASASARNLFNTINKGTKKSYMGLANTSKMLRRMMIQMLAFRAVMAAVNFAKEGINNLVQYSTELNGVFSDLKSSSAQLKNSLATAFAPILTMIIPYITQLVTWLNTALNYIAQFWAALAGKNTYTRAKKQLINYAGALKTTTDKAKEAQGALAAFDEINVLNKKDNLSGSDNGGELTGAEAFENVEIDRERFTWIDLLRDNLKTILTIVQAIGIGLLAWKISSLFGASMKEAAGLGIAVAGAFIFAKYAIDAWCNGVDWENLIGMFSGATVFVAGLSIAFGKLGRTIGMFVAGTGMVVVALHDIMENGISLQNSLLLIAGTFLAFSSVGGIAIGAIAAALAGLFVAIVSDWEDVKSTVLGPLKIWWSNIQQNFAQGISGIKDILSGLLTFTNGVFSLSWKQAWKGIKEIFVGTWDAMIGTVKFAINTGIGFINTLVNAMSAAFNAVIDAINSLKFTVPDWVPKIGGKTFGGLGIPNIPTPKNIPYLATGGIVTGATLAHIGEAGREVVLPLENNTEWMDLLADRMQTNNRPINVVFNGDLAELGRILKPVIDTENVRIGGTYQIV